jgi:hypothetical protein
MSVAGGDVVKPLEYLPRDNECGEPRDARQQGVRTLRRTTTTASRMTTAVKAPSSFVQLAAPAIRPARAA